MVSLIYSDRETYFEHSLYDFEEFLKKKIREREKERETVVAKR